MFRHTSLITTFILACLFAADAATGQTGLFTNVQLFPDNPQISFSHTDGVFYLIRSSSSGSFGGLFVQTNQSKIPFRIDKNADDETLSLRGQGLVGLGTHNPEGSLHIYTNGNADGDGAYASQLIVENDLLTADEREMMTLVNNGGSSIAFWNTELNNVWNLASDWDGSFTLDLDGTSGREFTIRPNGRVTMGPGGQKNFDLAANGNLTIKGTLTQNSDRNTKTAIIDIDANDILERVRRLPISTWQLKSDDPSVRHLGPMAQDFYREFQLGENERSIAPIDGVGVALAAIKALAEQTEKLASQQQRLDDQDRLIETLSQRIAALESTANQ